MKAADACTNRMNMNATLKLAKEIIVKRGRLGAKRWLGSRVLERG